MRPTKRKKNDTAYAKYRTNILFMIIIDSNKPKSPYNTKNKS
jgi:hypothetical protein